MIWLCPRNLGPQRNPRTLCAIVYLTNHFLFSWGCSNLRPTRVCTPYHNLNWLSQWHANWWFSCFRWYMPLKVCCCQGEKRAHLISPEKKLGTEFVPMKSLETFPLGAVCVVLKSASLLPVELPSGFLQPSFRNLHPQHLPSRIRTHRTGKVARQNLLHIPFAEAFGPLLGR